MNTNNLSDAFSRSNNHEIVACSGGIGFVEAMVAGLNDFAFHAFSELPPRTPKEEKALAWEPALIEPAANFTFETRIDDAIKGARDLYDTTADAWPVVIWEWSAGGYGYGHAIPEDTIAILFIDGELQAFEDGRTAR